MSDETSNQTGEDCEARLLAHAPVTTEPEPMRDSVDYYAVPVNRPEQKKGEK